jgi:hypothetical protein
MAMHLVRYNPLYAWIEVLDILIHIRQEAV